MAKNKMYKAQKEILRNKLKIGDRPIVVLGAFGTGDGCAGIVEEGWPKEKPEGGIYTKFVGCSYLFKGMPNMVIVEGLSLVKKAILSATTFLNTGVGKVALAYFLTLSKKKKEKFIAEFGRSFLEVPYKLIKKSVLPPQKYRIAVREIYRVSTKMVERTNGDMKVLAEMIRNIFCMILEYDYAYCARLQDVLPLLNKEAFRKNQIKELKRVFDIFIERSGNSYLIPKWEKLFGAFVLLLRVSKSVRKLSAEFIEDLDLGRLKLDEEDFYFCLLRGDYNFRGIDKIKRREIKEKIDKALGHQIPTLKFQK